MNLYKFALGILLGFYAGFQRLNQMRFIARDPVLTGILGVDRTTAAIDAMSEGQPRPKKRETKLHSTISAGPGAPNNLAG